LKQKNKTKVLTILDLHFGFRCRMFHGIVSLVFDLFQQFLTFASFEAPFEACLDSFGCARISNRELERMVSWWHERTSPLCHPMLLN
jgi:hypothetical protein